jgi:predicted nucleotidyltransferase component of viral defense system
MAKPPELENVLRDMAARTGISHEKLDKGYGVLATLRELDGLLGAKAVLFGGTALNLFYFGDKQRLSYDIDLEARNTDSIHALLSKHYRELTRSDIFYRFSADGVQIDLARSYTPAKAEYKKAKSMFEILGYPLADAGFRVYPFEVLFAEKMLAFTRRGAAKDLYDAWACIGMEYDSKKFYMWLVRLANRNRVDPRIIATTHHYADTDMGKIDSMLPSPNGKEMYEEVKDFVKALFFGK